MSRGSWIVFGALVLAMPLQGQGRPLTVTGVRSLAFGTVLPGIPRVVLRTDPANSGEFDIRGPNRGRVVVSFVLPVAMTGPAGALMPLSFGASDAGYSATRNIGSQVGFDPRLPFTADLPVNGRGAVYVGGTANPVSNQRAGAYTGTLTLNVTVLP